MQIKVGADASEAELVFLCHNKHDKAFVGEIAEALELETGTPIFLDVFAIPVGEAFIPAIEDALARSSGCAIFLGENGWGPTHFWEAEKALGRYRGDPEYRLLPVALPGIRNEDARRLGEGTLFREINWADFRQGPRDHEALEKLFAAVMGGAVPQYRGPARLTPYQIRRDANRWQNAKTPREKASILYRGAQLTEAETIVADSPDYAVIAEVSPFLSAAQQAVRLSLRRWIIGAGVVTSVTLTAAVAAIVAYIVAEERRLESTSRELAIVSQDAPRPDNQLLIALAAFDAAETPEARGNLAALLGYWRHLIRMEYLDSSVTALSGDDTSSSIVAGTSAGELVPIAAAGEHEPRQVLLPSSGGPITAILPLAGRTVIGLANGAVDVVATEGTAERLLPPLEAAPNQDRRILALAVDAKGELLAAGGADGSLRLLDATSGEALGTVDLSDKWRVTALAFDPTGPRLAAGTGTADLFIIDVDDPRKPHVRDSYPTRTEGEPFAIGFSREGQLVLIGRFALSRFGWSSDGLTLEGTELLETGFISAAAIGGDANLFALGDAGGYVEVSDLSSIQTRFSRVRGHGAPVTALAFLGMGDKLVSGAGDSSVALWDIAAGKDLSSTHERPPGEIVSLSLDRDILFAATSGSGEARLWRRQGEAWREELDLIGSSRRALGETVFETAEETPDEGSEIPAVALTGHAVAWTTRTGAVLWLDLSTTDGMPLVLSHNVADDGNHLAISRNGRAVAWPQHDGAAIDWFHTGRDGEVRKAVPPAEVRSLALDATGARLAAGLETGQVALFRVGRTEPDVIVQAHGAPVDGLQFSDDGGTLVSYGAGGGGSDRSVAIGSLPSLSDLAPLTTRLPGGSATALAIGRTTDLLAVGDHDGQVLLWSLSDRRFIGTLPAGGLWIPAIALDDARSVLWVAGSDGRLRSWDLTGSRAIELACRKTNRNLAASEWASLRPDDAYSQLCRTSDSRSEFRRTDHAEGRTESSNGSVIPGTPPRTRR